MKQYKPLGGGHYDCSYCGRTVFGTARHECDEMKVEVLLPEFAKAVKHEQSDTIILHHSAFSDNETDMLGKAIKYACKHGKSVQIAAD